MRREICLLLAASMAYSSAYGAPSAAIPSHCKDADMAEIVARGVPQILDLSPGSTSIDAVEMLVDPPKTISYPAVAGSPARHALKCPVKLGWSNGRTQFGTFTMWEDEYQQVMMALTP